MRMVLDTNVLVSALISPGRFSYQLLQFWEADEFTFVTSAEQLDELERVLKYEKLQRLVRPE
jgi:putative PIN family toxin of toxin-antitoxin system